VPPPRQQGHCGSCYAIAVTDMLTTRSRLAEQDNNLERFSANALLECSDYTQGCGSGFPFLAAKWAEDVGVVVESAAGQGCSLAGARGPARRAANARYVEPAALADEVERGPVVVSFIAPPSLHRYIGGIYEPEPSEDLTGEVTHAALLVGAGVADGEQYWVVQNSWGPDWGEHGRFRVLASTARTMLLETLAVAADVVPDDQPGVLAAVMEPPLALLQGAQQCTDGDVEVVIDGARRSLRFAGSEGTETAVNCVEPCQVSGTCSEADGCPCSLQGLPFAGMQALVEKASLLCEASGGLRLLLIGLGGGGIPTMIKQRCPIAHIESVEISATVARVASQFFGFNPSVDNTVEVADGAAAVSHRVSGGGAGAYDMVMVDCFSTGDAVPTGCRSAALLHNAKRLLRADGVVVQNIWARSAADSQKKLPSQLAAVRSLYASTFPQVREEIVAENDANQELLLAGVQGQRWIDLFN